MAEMLTAKDLIARHVRWKLTLQFVIASRDRLTEMQLDQILHAERCPIGQWLESAAPPGLRACPEYTAVVRNHVDFHRQMARIANLIEVEDFDAAFMGIQADSIFMQSSYRLALSITALDRIERILAPAS